MAGDERHSWWQTLPGILTATAGLLTAVTGLYIAISQNSGDDAGTTDPRAVTEAFESRQRERASRPPAGGTAAENKAGLPPAAPDGGGAGAMKPWAESEAALTMRDGSQNTVRAESLSNCISVHHSITLATGQEVAFERMRALEVAKSDASSTVKPRATVVVTLLDGRTLNGTIDAGCGWFGYNDIGRLDFNVDQLRRVDFQR
jgi:serine/threonine-protein kinase